MACKASIFIRENRPQSRHVYSAQALKARRDKALALLRVALVTNSGALIDTALRMA